MSENDFFAPPAFDAAAALQSLRRSLRDLRQLAERGDHFALRGHAVVETTVKASTIEARVAKRPALTPEWEMRTLRSNADVRQFVNDVKKRLARWGDEG